MRKAWLLLAVGAIVLAVLVYAWIDGGREPVREIMVPVPLPEPAG